MLNCGSSGESQRSFLSSNLEPCLVKITSAAVFRMEKLSGKDTAVVL